MSRIIALVNQKGGVGKTTSAVSIGAGLHNKGYKVLLIDLDPQGSLSNSVGIKAYEQPYTIYELLKGTCNVKDAIVKRTYDVIPADKRLTQTEAELLGKDGQNYRLKEAIEPIVNDYDYIIIDCSPSLGVLSKNGLTASSEVFIPTQAQFLSIQGMAELVETIKSAKRYTNPALEITGIIITMYEGSTNLNKDLANKLNELFNGKVFKTYIRKNISIAEAPGTGLDIYEYAPTSAGAIDYKNLVEEIINK